MMMHRLTNRKSMLPVLLVIFSFLSSFLMLLQLAAMLVVNYHGEEALKNSNKCEQWGRVLRRARRALLAGRILRGCGFEMRVC